jgi:antitoxin HicB
MSKPSEYAVTLYGLSTDEGGGYLAVAQDLPGCMADGATPQQAYANAMDAIAEWIATATDMGRPIPNPSRLPKLEQKVGQSRASLKRDPE